MNVVTVAVVGGGGADHRLEFRRSQRRELETVEAAPGDADHTHRATAPVLLPDPADDFDPVIKFLLQVFILQNALGVAAAAQINPEAGVAVAREIGWFRASRARVLSRLR